MTCGMVRPGSLKGKERQKKAVENYFDGLDDEAEAAPQKGSKSKAKASLVLWDRTMR